MYVIKIKVQKKLTEQQKCTHFCQLKLKSAEKKVEEEQQQQL